MSRLLFFPTPYPGESMYSIMARIHQRSGNSKSIHTREKLLNSPGVSIYQYIISPVHREYVEEWFPENTDAASIWEDLRSLHSAAPLEFLCSNWAARSELGPAFPHETVACKRKRWPAALCNNLKPNRWEKLKYCPLCGAQQISSYGECYWEVLPQIDHVHYCPIHEVPYLESETTTWDANKNFIPLSEVIAPSKDTAVLLKKREYRDMELQYSKNILWLLENGALFKNVLFDKIRSLFLCYFRAHKMRIDERMNYILNQYEPKYRVRVDMRLRDPYYLSVFQILSIIETYFFPVTELVEHLNNF